VKFAAPHVFRERCPRSISSLVHVCVLIWKCLSGLLVVPHVISEFVHSHYVFVDRVGQAAVNSSGLCLLDLCGSRALMMRSKLICDALGVDLTNISP